MTDAVKTLTKRLYKQNKGRNLVAVLAVILTTMMFTTLFVLTQSMSKNLVEMMFRQTGHDAHASFKIITDEQIEMIAGHSDVQEVGRSIVVGVAMNRDLTGRQVEIRYGSDIYAEDTFSLPTEGRMPQTTGEIALDDIVLQRLGIPFELGQQVTIEWTGDFYSDETMSSTFTLCGWWEGNASSYASMAWVSEEFALETCGYAENNTEDRISGMRMAHVSLHSDADIEGTMDRILADIGIMDLRYNVNLAYDPSMQVVASQESISLYLGMILVFIAGYLIIYNVFQISVATDIQFYGKLKTLGTTGKQIRKLIYGQANRICIFGIPIGLATGYLLGSVLVPVLISGLDIKATASTSPVIFIGSAIFGWLTVLISCLRPAKIAGKVSAMEALRYSDAETTGGRRNRKNQNGASLSGMAWANLGRNKKRTMTLICSLTLGLVLLSCFYAKDASFDMEKYLSSLTISDFQVDDATSGDYTNGYNSQGRTITSELLTQVESLDGLEATGRLYSQEMVIPLSSQALENILNFYEYDNRLSYIEDDLDWMAGYHEAVENKEVSAVIYGVDGIVWDILAQSQYHMDGTFDSEKFASGEYILAFGIGTDDFSEQMPTFSVGEIIELEGREYTVMGIIDPIEPITSGEKSAAFYLQFVIPADSFQELWPKNTIRKLYFNVADDELEAAEVMLMDYQKNVDTTMPYKSRQTMVEQYKAQTRSAAVMGNAVSVVIALVGVLNFINSMVTAIVSRKKEFAMIQSVGMTKKQLRKMLIFEGLDYAGLTLIASYVLSGLGVGVVIRAMVSDSFTATFHFTLLPLALCTPIILVFAVIVPYICFKNLEKKSIVERLRIE